MTAFSVRQHRGFTTGATWWASLNAERSNENRASAKTRHASLRSIITFLPESPRLEMEFRRSVAAARMWRMWS